MMCVVQSLAADPASFTRRRQPLIRGQRIMWTGHCFETGQTVLLTGTVKRIDKDGTVVAIPDNNLETPIAMIVNREISSMNHNPRPLN